MWSVDGDSPLATHQSTDSTSFADVKSCELGREGARDKFGHKSKDTDQDDVSPSDSIIEQTQIGLETGQSEVLQTH
jgi:hypothetical protein